MRLPAIPATQFTVREASCNQFNAMRSSNRLLGWQQKAAVTDASNERMEPQTEAAKP